ncbi:hypothetical protein I553_0395 [Mycobacterium xenopi 4042]|uniref:Uncharacterized protein n=1 Tax=Mycobacterium xenopi 4042 TaxID=1299334 RepID=X7YJL0_MYCXE|nr:hypothetical protein I553_0395 [Mycobacterium xenopi 4042]
MKVGIDPIRIMTDAGTFYTLRCYFDDRPIFLGRNGRISVFSSERALARYLADEHDHDLSDLSTYDDIRTAATDGSLQVDITDDNVYVLTAWPTIWRMDPMRWTVSSWSWPSNCFAMWANTPRTTPSKKRSRPIGRWASWSPTCSNPTRSASRRPVCPGGARVGAAGAVRGVAAKARVGPASRRKIAHFGTKSRDFASARR